MEINLKTKQRWPMQFYDRKNKQTNKKKKPTKPSRRTATRCFKFFYDLLQISLADSQRYTFVLFGLKV